MTPKAEMKAQGFPLTDVRLLDGPFKHAMDLNAEYLLHLEPDRLLHRFRENAGLKPKAPIYGGWESDTISGHSLGHYLSACACQFAASGDERFNDRTGYIVDELATCQQVHPRGYVAGIPEGDRWFLEVEKGDIRSKGFDLNGIWVPWYTQHKLFAGLLDAHKWCGNEKALRVAATLGDWAIDVTKNLSPEQWQTMLACEHGGMNEAMAELYAQTGEVKYLDLARKFHHKAILDPLEAGEDRLSGVHGNTQIPKVVGTAREYELSGEEGFRRISETFWNAVVRHHTYAMGGHGMHEYFGPPDELANRLSHSNAETCNTYNMLKLTAQLFTWEPKAEYADFFENAVLNHILSTQEPTTGMMCYFTPLAPNSAKEYSSPDDSFWCCVGTGMENHTRYGEGIYFHDANGLHVNLFIASTLEWRERGVTVRQETRFPGEAATRLTIACGKPAAFALRIRRPKWAVGAFAVKVNGAAAATSAEPGSYAVVERTWNDGDAVEVSLPMALRVEPMPDNASRVALMFGPVVLAGDLGPEEQEDVQVPVLVTDGKPVADWVKPEEGKALTFRTAGVGRPNDVELRPLYAIHHRRYAVYWDVFASEAWTRLEVEYRAEQERQRDLEARTVDEMRLGEMQPERDHNFQGERTRTGEAHGRKWRDAELGGWFSFEVKVDGAARNELRLTYWGGDSGGREFDVLVDGQTVETVTLVGDRPQQFYDGAYALPEALTQGKAKVTVRLQGHRRMTAGGVFGARVVRVE